MELSQDSPKDITHLIIVEAPRNLHVPHLLDLVSSIPKWNARVDNSVISIFEFVDKYFARDGSMLFFYNDDFRNLKDIKSHLENYNFKIHLKFVVVNNMHYTNPKFHNKKVNLFCNTTKASSVHVSSILTYILYYVIDFHD